MANVFDQFDTPATGPQNVFDQFDAPASIPSIPSAPTAYGIAAKSIFPTLPSFLQNYIGNTVERDVSGVKQLVNPDTWKQVWQGLHNPNDFDANGRLKPEVVQKLRNAAWNIGLSTMPVTPMSGASRAMISGKQALALTPQQAALQAGQKAGLVVPPSEINPNQLNILESISGKAATRQGASQINASKLNDLTRQELGIPQGKQITDQVLADVRQTAGKAYQAVKDYGQPIVTNESYLTNVQSLAGDISQAAKEFPDLVKNDGVETLIKSLSVPQMSAKSAVELSKLLRFKATSNLKAFNDPEKVALGMAQRKSASLIEDLMGQNLAEQGQGALATAWNNARTLIAKTHDVEASLRPNGNVDPKVWAKLIEKRKPLSGNLQTMGNFAAHFPNAVQDVTKAGSPNVSNLQAMLSPLFAGGGAMVAGGPGAFIGGAIPFVTRPLARSVLFSHPYQAGLLPKLPSTMASVFPVQRGLLALGAQDGLLGQ